MEPYPNTFTFCDPADAEWLGWYAANAQLDGYLRWALNSWVIEPLLDSRFYTWAAGDTYLIYPGARTSIRMERMSAGVQAFEKVRILREEFKEQGDEASLKILEEMLDSFEEYRLPEPSSASVVAQAIEVVASLTDRVETGIPTLAQREMSVRGENGALVIEGAYLNTMVRIYQLDGTLVRDCVVTENPMRVTVPGDAVYVVRIGDRSFKVNL